MTYKKKLIEVAIPLAAINAESAREKSIRHGHPSALHLWWARRPLSSARAVLFAQLVDDPSAHPERFPTPSDQQIERERLFDLMARLVPWEATTDSGVMAEAHAEILKSCDGELPRILDPFGGGATIPLEAVRLGLPSYSGDLNPVAVLIQRSMIEIPHRFADAPPVHPDALVGQGIWQGAEGLAADVEAYARWMLEEASRRIGEYYPQVTLDDGTTTTAIAWIWVRTVRSPDPAWAGHVPLARSWEVAKRPGKSTVWIEPIVDHAAQTITYEVRSGGSPAEPTVERGNGRCVATGAPIPGTYIKEEAMAGRMGEQLIAVVADGRPGRIYVSPNRQSPTPPVPKPQSMVSGAVPRHLTGGTCAVYGLDDWSKLFTTRQGLALTTLSDLLPEAMSRVMGDAKDLVNDGVRLADDGAGRRAYAEAIVTYLALFIDKCADYWSCLCGWDKTKGETIRNTFARQALPMTWDFAEANPFSNSTGSAALVLERLVMAVRRLPTNRRGWTAQMDARARITDVGRCVLATDPPYYDNISYADLSDFFFVWLRRNLNVVWPDECSTLLTPKVEELIANQHRAGSKAAAHKHFELGMQGVFGRAAENADERFPATVFYAFKATESAEEGVRSTGWETFLHGLLEAGFAVTATWPMRTELGNRMIASGTNALATSVVLACRKRELTAPLATRGEFVAALRLEMPPAIRLLQAQNIAPVDMAQSAIGPGIAVFSRYAKVVEADGTGMTVRSALALVNEVLSEVLSGEESEFDADTRFALTWFEQYGHNPAPFGDADSLARAKNTTVDGVVRAGVAASRDGKVRLVERSELPLGWSPARDSRLTVWETTQHLIRALDASETEAAGLLRLIGGGMGERARQLAYLLYGICDRKKWADEAGAYNMLVSAWPEVERLAASSLATDSGPERLF